MRIALASDFYPPQLSGIADSVELQAAALRARGHELRIYAPQFSGAREDALVRRFPSLLIPGSGGQALVFPVGMLADLRRFKPDVIHPQTMSTIGLAALYAGWQLRIPVVATDHTSPAHYLHYYGLAFPPFPYLVRTFAALFHARATYVTAPSEHILDELYAYGMRRTPREVISNPVRLDLFRPLPDKPALKQKYGIGENAVVLFGRVALEKNLAAAAEVFARVRKSTAASLVIIGDGPYREELARKIAALGISAQARFLGVLRGEALNEALNACDVFLTTSLSEIQPMATLQAMAAGLPVVAADAGGLPECVIEGNTGYLVPPSDIEGFAARVTELLADPLLRKEFGAAAVRATTGYHPETVARHLEEIYGKVLRTDMRVSFAIPAYNEEAVIPGCLESVLAEVRRSGVDAEVVVVNNASTDRTEEVAARFPAVRVVLETRKGLTYARQAGMEATSHELIANIDADTLVPPGWVTTVIEEFSNNPDLVALSGPFYYYDLSPLERMLVRIFYGAGYLFYLLNHRLLGGGGMLQGGNFVVRRAALEAIGGFDTGIAFYGEDTDVARRLAPLGLVKWTWHLPMHASGRRLRTEGVLRTGARYALNFFSTLFLKRPASRAYTDVRPGATAGS